MSVLSFDFSEVKIGGDNDLSSIPTDTVLYATVDSVTAEEFNGVPKFVFQQTIYTDPNDEAKTVQLKTYIGPKHGWLLAQYLEAVGEDFRSLSGQKITADALETVLVGHPLNVKVQRRPYTGGDGKERTSTQINWVRKGA